MRPRSLIAISLAAALLPLAPVRAEAKAQQTVSVCGVSACMSTDDPALVGALHSTFAPAPAPSAAPFYVVRFSVRGERQAWSYVYVPSVRAMRSDDFGEGTRRWQDAAPLRTSLPDLTRLAPYPASATWRRSRDAPRDVPWVSFPSAAEHATLVKICGASACIEINSPSQVRPLGSNIGAPAPTPAPGPSYAVRFEERATDGGRREVWSYAYVPSAGAMRSDEFGHGPKRWRHVPEEIASALPDLSGLTPIPAAPRAGGDRQRSTGVLAVFAVLLLAAVVARRWARV